MAKFLITTILESRLGKRGVTSRKRSEVGKGEMNAPDLDFVWRTLKTLRSILESQLITSRKCSGRFNTLTILSFSTTLEVSVF